MYTSVIIISSNSIKVGVFDEDKLIFMNSEGFKNIKAEIAFKTITNLLLNIPQHLKVGISKLIIGGLRSGFLTVNKDGRIVVDVMPWYDKRALKEAEELERKIPGIFEVTGLRCLPYYSAPKILWLKRYYPEKVEKSYKFLLLLDYILSKLIGEKKHYYTDITIVNRTLMYNIRKREWSDEILSLLDVNEDKLPEVSETGKVLGILGESVRRKTRMSKVEVINAGGDQQLSIYALADLKEDEVALNMDTGVFVLKPLKDLKPYTPKFIYSIHTDNRLFVLEGVVITAGLALSYMLHLLDLTYEAVRKAYPIRTNIIYTPFISGRGSPSWNPNIPASIFNLSLWSDKIEILKAVIEGILFEIKCVIESLNQEGINIKRVKVSGELSSDECLIQMLSDVLNLPVVRIEPRETVFYGALKVAGNQKLKIKESKVLYPNDKLVKYYEEKYDYYKKIVDYMEKYPRSQIAI